MMRDKIHGVAWALGCGLLISFATSATASDFVFKHKVKGMDRLTSSAEDNLPSEPEMEPVKLFLDPVSEDDYFDYADRSKYLTSYTGRAEGGYVSGDTVTVGSSILRIDATLREDGSFSVELPTQRAIYGIESFNRYVEYKRQESDGSISTFTSSPRMLAGYDKFEVPSLYSKNPLPDSSYFASSSCSDCHPIYAFDGYNASAPEASGSAQKIEREGYRTIFSTANGVTEDFYVGIDFGQQTIISGYAAAYPRSNNRPTVVSLQVSNDNYNWNTVLTKTLDLASSYEEQFSQDSVTARYARLYVHESLANKTSNLEPSVVISEFTVFGDQVN